MLLSQTVLLHVVSLLASTLNHYGMVVQNITCQAAQSPEESMKGQLRFAKKRHDSVHMHPPTAA